MKRVFALVPALVLAATFGVASAEARGLKGGNISGGDNAYNWGNNGRAHFNQNGNGCRNRCYYLGDAPTYNNGWNNGNINLGGNFNSVVSGSKGKSHGHKGGW